MLFLGFLGKCNKVNGGLGQLIGILSIISSVFGLGGFILCQKHRRAVPRVCCWIRSEVQPVPESPGQDSSSSSSGLDEARAAEGAPPSHGGLASLKTPLSVSCSG